MATSLSNVCYRVARHTARSNICANNIDRCSNVRVRQFSSSYNARIQESQHYQATAQRPRRRPANSDSADALTNAEPNRVASNVVEMDGIDESELSSTGHAELEQHREVREMMRLAAWDMPLLTQHAKEFEAPDKQKKPLRWRYTTYFGEAHPASRKVVVEFQVANLGLSRQAGLKLKKLVGVRYNPDTDTVRMSNDSFDTQARNKRFLADTIKTLIAEAKDKKADSFKDIPLDLRHHKPKPNLEFPAGWNMTAERRELLESQRERAQLEEGQRIEQNQITSGVAAIDAELEARRTRAEEELLVLAQRETTKGKGGRGSR